MAMARLHFLLLFFFALILSASSRSIPLGSTPSSSSSSPPRPITKPGPIATNGKNYTKVCDAERFADMGLNMEDFAYCNGSVSFADRVKDLIGRMTLAEKILQLGDTAYGVHRIGLPEYRWWSEALHGVSFVGEDGRKATYFGDIVPGATSFPTVIVSAASFNESLWKKIGQVVSTEARAMYNLGHAGLTYWSPNVNVVRDPRWGRVLETPGEDPFVVGRYAVNFVRGLQDVEGHELAQDLNTRPLKVSSCCKHYSAYDLDNWFGTTRYDFDARVAEQDMVETFNRPFEMCVKEGDVSSVMCSYNRVNGFPACADARLLSQTIRGEWNLHGYIVSDCDSIEVMQHGHHWLHDQPEDAVAQVMNAGLNLDCGVYYTNYTGSAVAQGKVKESDIDNALHNLYMVLMRLGFFDGTPAYDSLGKDDICTKENIELAADAARQGIVLLKNNNTLPLSTKKHGKVAMVGPHVNATTVMIGNYEGVPCRIISPLKAFSDEVTVDYKEGCNVTCNDQEAIFTAMKAAKNARATIIFAGLDRSVESEGLDRNDLLLPGYQTQLINQVAEAATGPVVLVIFSAGGVDIGFAKNNPKIGAIVWAGYPGAEGGRAIADVVFGRCNPGGRLPITWYEADYVEQLPMTSMQLRPADELGYPGRTYKFFNGSTVYPFGYGLSYTQFSYTIKSSQRSLTAKLGKYQHCQPLSYKPSAFVPSCPSIVIQDSGCKEEINFEVEVANTGSMDGNHVVMVYSKPPSDIIGAPSKQLVAFQRVSVKAGEVVRVKFSLNACSAFGIVEKTAYYVLPSGEHKIEVGQGDGLVSFPVQIKFHK